MKAMYLPEGSAPVRIGRWLRITQPLHALARGFFRCAFSVLPQDYLLDAYVQHIDKYTTNDTLPLYCRSFRHKCNYRRLLRRSEMGYSNV